MRFPIVLFLNYSFDNNPFWVLKNSLSTFPGGISPDQIGFFFLLGQQAPVWTPFFKGVPVGERAF